MKRTIEEIWKEGFLDEKSLVAPKLNNLYNLKSIHMIERIKRIFRINMYVILATAVAVLPIYYAIDAMGQGVAASALFFLIAWYNVKQWQGIKTLDPGVTSLDYLKALDEWFQDVLARGERVARFFYPLCFVIAISTIWSALGKSEDIVLRAHERFPDVAFVGNLPWFALVIAGVLTVFVYFLSDKLYKLDVRLMYGSVLVKLRQTISEMEALRQE